MPLAAIALLLLNDQLLKASFPGPLTGKLSDVAGLAFAPLLLVGIVEVLRAVVRRPRPVLGRPAVTALVGLVGAGFAIAKLTGPGAEAYRVGLGLLQWPFRVLEAILGGSSLPAPVPVAFVADPTDVVALPVLVVPLAIGLARSARATRRTAEPGSSAPGAPAGGRDTVAP